MEPVGAFHSRQRDEIGGYNGGNQRVQGVKSGMKSAGTRGEIRDEIGVVGE